MLKFLVAVDGSAPSGRAVDHLIRHLGLLKEAAEIHLLNVQHPIPYGSRVTSVVGHDKIAQFHRDEGLAALKTAMQKLDAAGIKYHHHIGVGHEADVICQYAREKGCDHVIMGTRGLGSVSNLVLGSVATKVLHLSPVPVLLVK
ncbi:MAG TPA: universal stress protein [Alphaproteobacteria bacterium]|jgi:nucleotide-binding universal stress UspA family protein